MPDLEASKRTKTYITCIKLKAQRFSNGCEWTIHNSKYLFYLPGVWRNYWAKTFTLGFGEKNTKERKMVEPWNSKNIFQPPVHTIETFKQIGMYMLLFYLVFKLRKGPLAG